jgi:hypothetical protein
MRFSSKVVLLGLFLSLSPNLFGGCTASCTGSAWQKTATVQTKDPSERTQIRFVGFGTGVADKAIACSSDDKNPPFNAASVRWQDFRFYGVIPGIGVVRGTLNSRHESFVSLSASGSTGLFPATLTNHLYIELSTPGRPVKYQNNVPLEMQASGVTAAPPQVSLVSHQVKSRDVFKLTARVPGAPEQLTITEGEQKFLGSGSVKLEKLANEGTLLRFRVTNLLRRQLTVAYFLHMDGVDPAALSSPDGVIDLAAGAAHELRFRVPGAATSPSGSVYAIVLAPSVVEGSDRLQF